ncbi:uncharacterized protein PITG_07662 [Phytophthora infestans T30-4]|uniref:Uncharacterized protein n=1 Tax=Phytophthora infestans (strain T30-4) TaxID=403677 RepID=D0N8U7_PHYIT|nr:uncharacterized protein PITG_07662 [Phytophthora infestans T30-4]EEY53982.1 conserved hypothetical protein [Phytophthora infestans T30-4]|eukprot:XP_002904613.1 conserved hypothetical protein [Phytophthora infestans T30-4]
MVCLQPRSIGDLARHDAAGFSVVQQSGADAGGAVMVLTCEDRA